jgi:hypothetical protein
MTKHKHGLIIKVTESRYDMYGTPGSKRDAILAAIVKSQGGINHSVTPGTYEFKVYRKGFRIYTSLEPYTEK